MISRLDHVAIVTKDLAASLRFFEEQLGLLCTHQEELPDRGIRVAMLPIGDPRIELIESLHDKSEVSGFLEKRGPGLHHLCFHSDAIEADMEHIKAQGGQLTSDAPKPGAHGCQVAFVHPKSTGGVLVELLNPL